MLIITLSLLGQSTGKICRDCAIISGEGKVMNVVRDHQHCAYYTTISLVPRPHLL